MSKLIITATGSNKLIIQGSSIALTNAPGGGAVTSVNGQTGVVVLDSDNVSEGTTNLYNKVPAGGITGQILSKVDGDDYNLEWADNNAGFGNISQITGLTYDGTIDLIQSGTKYNNLYFDQYDQSGALSIPLPLNGVDGDGFVIALNTDGSAINFASGWNEINNDYATDSAIYLLVGIRIAGQWFYNVKLTDATPVDVTPPTLISATIEDATDTQIDLVFDEAVTLTNLGFSLSGIASSPTITSISGSGTANITLNLSAAVVESDVPLLSYDSGTGDCVDGSGNPLASFAPPDAESDVTNNVTESFTSGNPMSFETVSPNLTVTGGNNVTKDLNDNAWTDFAIDTDGLSGDFDIYCVLPAVDGLIGSFGLDDNISGGGGLFSIACLSDNTLQAFEDLTVKGSKTSVYPINVVLRINRTGTTITYYYSINNGLSWTLIYTSLITSSATLYPFVRIFDVNKSVNNCRVLV